MLLILYLVALAMACRSNAWAVRNPFEMIPPPKLAFHTISDCMHVASEEGLYSFKKSTPDAPPGDLHTVPELPPTTVCGLYVVADPEQNIEMSVKYLNVNCAGGGLMGFVDGWELNGQYFPGVLDHELPIDQRVTEFCSDGTNWPFQFQQPRAPGRTFRSHQNAALLQYRIPAHGSFVVSVRFVANKKPCHIMAEGLAPSYTLRNFGQRSNCTLTALFPGVVSVKQMSVGRPSKDMSFNCAAGTQSDRMEIGGSTGLESSAMEVASAACGATSENDIDSSIEQAIFCGTTTVRLVSSGQYDNRATIAVRPADEDDLALMTAVCDA